MPKVSLILCTKNRASLLKEMLFSVIQQTLLDWECIVVDDGDSSETFAVVNNFNDSRVKYFKRPENYKAGLPGSRNFGITKISAAYLHFIDDDDILHPSFLEIKWNATRAMNNPDYVISPLLNFSEAVPQVEVQNQVPILKSIDWKDYLKGKSGVFSCSVLWKSTCFTEFKFNENLSVSEDYDVYWKLFKNYNNGVEVTNPLYFRRVHENTNSDLLRNSNNLQQQDFITTRLNAFDSVLKDRALNLDLARFFMFFALKHNLQTMEKDLWSWNIKANQFTFKDKRSFVMFRLKQKFKA